MQLGYKIQSAEVQRIVGILHEDEELSPYFDYHISKGADPFKAGPCSIELYFNSDLTQAQQDKVTSIVDNHLTTDHVVLSKDFSVCLHNPGFMKEIFFFVQTDYVPELIKDVLFSNLSVRGCRGIELQSVESNGLLLKTKSIRPKNSFYPIRISGKIEVTK